MFNNQCENFKNDIVNIINNSNLPPMVIYYILKDSLRDLEQICKEVLEYEIQEEAKKAKQGKNEEEKKEAE